MPFIPMRKGGTVHDQVAFPELPYEIWLHITSFLDYKTRRGLYSVNRSLFNIAMNERYYHALIAWNTMYTSFPFVEIRDPSSAARVRDLVIHQGSSCRQMKGRTSQRILNKLWKIVKSRVLAVDSVNDVLNVVPYLTSVNGLLIETHSLKDRASHPFKLTVLQKGWSVYGSNLQSLTLDSPLEDLPSILEPAPKLPRLEKLHISIQTVFRTSDPDLLMRETILPFIKTHHDTLRGLTLHASSEVVDMSSFLLLLPHMPSLVDFGLSQAFTNPKLTRHTKFLEVHSHQLRNLCFEFLNIPLKLLDLESDWFGKGFWRLHFPELESLHLSMPRHNTSSNGVARRYLKRYIHTLISLKFDRWIFQYDDIYSVFSDVQGFSRLRNLSLHILNLSPDILCLFAEKLPCLQQLSLETLYLRPIKDIAVTYDERIIGFCRALESTVYPEWKIYSLWISVVSRLPKAEKELVTQVLFAAFPNLQVLCGETK